MHKNRGFISFLGQRLLKQLPGLTKQLEMAPVIGNVPFRDIKTPATANRSAVLIILQQIGNSYELLFTLRNKNMYSHAGQISFPGGRCDTYETPEQTALREASEEVGLFAEDVKILGLLTELYVPPSNNVITPVLALALKPLEVYIASPEEVEEIFSVDIHSFTDENLVRELWDFDGHEIEVPYWKVHNTPLWGATSMILKELTALWEEFLSEEN